MLVILRGYKRVVGLITLAEHEVGIFDWRHSCAVATKRFSTWYHYFSIKSLFFFFFQSNVLSSNVHSRYESNAITIRLIFSELINRSIFATVVTMAWR